MKIATVCGSGVGSSMMLKVYAQQILKAEGIEAEVDASDITSISPASYDIIVTTTSFSEVLRGADDKTIKIDNLMDKEYLKEKLLLKINELNGGN